MYNQVRQNIGLGRDRGPDRQFGPNFGLSTDPTKQNYDGYNNDHITRIWNISICSPASATAGRWTPSSTPTPISIAG